MSEFNSLQVLFSKRTTTGDSDIIRPKKGNKQIQASGLTTASTGSATILVYGSNDKAQWVLVATINLDLTTTESDSVVGDTIKADWPHMKANVSTISGTGAKVNVSLGANI